MKAIIIAILPALFFLYSCDTTNVEAPDTHYIVFEASSIESIDREPDRRYITRVERVVESSINFPLDYLLIHDPGYALPLENDWVGIHEGDFTIRVENDYGSWVVADFK